MKPSPEELYEFYNTTSFEKRNLFIIKEYFYNDRRIIVGFETISFSVWFQCVFYKTYVKFYSLSKRIEEDKLVLSGKKKPILTGKIKLTEFNLKEELEHIEKYVQTTHKFEFISLLKIE